MVRRRRIGRRWGAVDQIHRLALSRRPGRHRRLDALLRAAPPRDRSRRGDRRRRGDQRCGPLVPAGGLVPRQPALPVPASECARRRGGTPCKGVVGQRPNHALTGRATRRVTPNEKLPLGHNPVRFPQRALGSDHASRAVPAAGRTSWACCCWPRCPAWLTARRLRGLGTLLGMGLVYWVLWCLLRQNVRFLLPIVPLGTVGVAWCWIEMRRASPGAAPGGRADLRPDPGSFLRLGVGPLPGSHGRGPRFPLPRGLPGRERAHLAGRGR